MVWEKKSYYQIFLERHFKFDIQPRFINHELNVSRVTRKTEANYQIIIEWETINLHQSTSDSETLTS